MLRKTTLILFFVLASISAYAFDNADFNSCLGNYAESISQAAYSASEKADSAERAAFEAAAERADKAEKRIRDIISAIETAEEFAVAEKSLADFAAASELNSHTVAMVEKVLQQRAAFISSNREAASPIAISAVGKAAAAPELLLNKRQKRLVMIDVPVAEAVISLEDTKHNRRIDNLNEIFKRHGCRVISQNTTDDDKLVHGLYFSGKKYVVDALLGHFGGDVVNSDLKAVVKITTGGFWSGKKSIEIKIEPNSSNGVMGELSWYKSVIEKDPTRFLAENHYSQLATLGTIETIAGEKKLQLKNAIAEIWVMSKNGTARNAVYSSKSELGDLFVNVR
jgi:hypothetical protein